MSKVYTRLHSLFSSTRNAANTIQPKLISTSDHISSINRSIKDLFTERDSNKLAQKFKSLSEHTYFREKTKIYGTIIHRLYLEKQFTLIEDALEYQKNYICSEEFGARIISLFGRAGMWKHAHKVFDELPERGYEQGVQSFNALLGAALNSEKFDELFEVFLEVPMKLSIEPSNECYNTAARALCKVGMIDEAVALLDEMEKRGLKPCVILYNTILGAYYENGKFEEGDKMWERMVENGVKPDIMSYDCKLYGLVHDEKVSGAMDLIMEIESKGLKPDVGTFNALILIFCNIDDLVEVTRCYKELLNNGYDPNTVTLNTIVPYLCNKNDYEFAFQVCKMMFRRPCLVDASLLQRVVDGLVRSLKSHEAEILVGLGRSNCLHPYDLVLPSRGSQFHTEMIGWLSDMYLE